MINPIVVYYQKKNESVQYNTGLAITDATRGTSKDKLYQDLNLWKTEGDREVLSSFIILQEVLSTKLPTYLYDLIQPILNSHRNPGCYRALYCRTNLFRNSFLLFSANKWNKIGSWYQNSRFSCDVLQKAATFYNVLGKKHLRYISSTKILTS